MRSITAVAQSQWFDHWHLHVDWKGRARRAENRPASIAVALKLLKAAEDVATSTRQPVQVWLALGPTCMDDAVYLHSRNANGTPFPHSFDNVNWEMDAPDWLPIRLGTHALGKAQYDEGTVLIVIGRDLLGVCP